MKRFKQQFIQSYLSPASQTNFSWWPSSEAGIRYCEVSAKSRWHGQYYKDIEKQGTQNWGIKAGKRGSRCGPRLCGIRKLVGRQRTSHEMKEKSERVRNRKYKKVIADEKNHRGSNRESSGTGRGKKDRAEPCKLQKSWQIWRDYSLLEHIL